MHVFNSGPTLSQDDTDVTMINHSLLYDGNDEPISSCIPIVRRLQHANQTKSTNSDDKHDYNYVNHYHVEIIKQIELILNYYRQDLKQESNTQLDCNRQLITRLVDFIRPAYSSNANQMKDLDVLYEDISSLLDKRFIEQKEKNDQLQNKIRHLRNSIITTPIEDDDRDSLMTNLYRMNTMFDYEQWTEIEEETKKLQNLVNTQREQIDKLIELLSQTEIAKDEKDSTIENSVDLPTQEVINTTTEIQIINQAEKRLSTPNIVDSNVSMGAAPLQCPYCNEILPNNDETVYIQHLSQCFNEMTGNF